MSEDKPKAKFEIKASTPKELRNAYGVSKDTWQTWMQKMRELKPGMIPDTKAVLTPAQVKLITDQFGEP